MQLYTKFTETTLTLSNMKTAENSVARIIQKGMEKIATRSLKAQTTYCPYYIWILIH